MKHYFTILLILIISSAYAQSMRTISGTILEDSGSPAKFMTVTLEGSVLGTTSDEKGNFVLKNIKSGKYILRITGIGYSIVRSEVDVTSKDVTELKFSVQPSTDMLGEIIVSASRTVEALDETPSSVHVVDSKMINTQMQK